jgi:predicted permease
VFTSTLTPMLMMFLCIVIGYALNKLKLLPENADTVLAKTETYVLVPALNISTFMNYCTVESLSAYRPFLTVSVILITVAISIAIPLSGMFTKDSYQRNIYKYALTFGNFGFLGNAIVPIILGEEFLYPYLLFTLPLNAMCYIWGLSLLVPAGNSNNIFRNLLNPCVISIGIGAVLGLTGMQPVIPSFAKLTLSNLSACMGPIAMILTGFVAAKYRIGDLLNKPFVYLATLFRLILLPVAFIAVLVLLGIDALIIKMCLFAYATPLGLNTVVFPTAYNKDASTGASMALISHTLCVVTIPLLYTVLTYILGK